jgi:hypothetical protein
MTWPASLPSSAHFLPPHPLHHFEQSLSST